LSKKYVNFYLFIIIESLNFMFKLIKATTILQLTQDSDG